MPPGVAVGPPTVVETWWQAQARGSGVCPLPPHGRGCHRAPEGEMATSCRRRGNLGVGCAGTVLGGVAMAGL